MIRKLWIVGLWVLIASQWGQAAGMPGAGHMGPRIMGPHGGSGCRMECRHEFVMCLAAVRLEARLCRQECRPLLRAAREACAADPEGQACADARAAARDCLQPCRAAGKDGMRACVTDVRACMADCPRPRPLPPKDPDCLAACRDGLHDCRTAVRDETRDCVAACADLRDEVRAVCGEDRTSAACEAARAELRDCVRPCREGWGEGTRECVGGARACVEECPDVDDSAPTG